MIKVTKKGFRGQGIYVGRPSKWGNPFKLRRHGGRYSLRESLRLYKKWIESKPELIDELVQVYKEKGELVLDCWCVERVYSKASEIKRVKCHAEILAWLVLREVSK